jgi:arginine/lysine/ornithine decarboxylase
MTEHAGPPSPANTPFADAVLRLRRSADHGERIVSFHALPWSQGRSLVDSGRIGEKYRLIFGDEYLASEVAYSGAALDSFFRPTASLEVAQQLAAEAFGADHTFFVTCGTTVANSVAFDALAEPGKRVLIDRMSHQSIHVAAGHSRASVSYTPCVDAGHPSSQSLLDVSGLIRMIADAYQADQPFDAVALAAASYDGLLYNLHWILTACVEASPGTAFLIDEAWAAVNAFHPRLRALTALDAAARIRATGIELNLLVTQSAHKSMSAARQGSYLHAIGDSGLIGRVRSALYGRHTTSPSIPILASLDLARAHAEIYGERLVQRAIELADKVQRTVREDPQLADYRASSYAIHDVEQLLHFSPDPTKVFIDVSGIGLRGDEVKARLFDDYGIYVARTMPGGFLINLHIGLTEADVDRLLETLRSLARRERSRSGNAQQLDDQKLGDPVNHILIAYPPGVPLAVPGETWTEQLVERLADSRRCGIDVYALPVSSPAGEPALLLN